MQEETHIHLGTVYFEMGEEHYVDALREENLALEMNPHSKFALFNKALTLKRLKQFIQSEQIFIELSLTDVKDREVHVHLADLYLLQGEFQKAEPYIRRVLELNPADATGLSLLGEMYEQAGKIEMAIETLHQLLKVEPGNIEIYADLANLYKKINNLAKAKECIAHIQRLSSLD
ncbi:tetratricopeptide (TPR) repeat protein [Paenibacillus shirakamiensis]|uniref:Tetratricopeptide (TPR) repeat protein n=2 Tax=Paenibacillus shirakamiensis TaxID=1265935 RepID=A0ABS4JJT4_9BACL|nr:tetratricopeptide (TPR) repeat protein [Paenibacillus shirakamiensis]